jgi:hypothetical protein
VPTKSRPRTSPQVPPTRDARWTIYNEAIPHRVRRMFAVTTFVESDPVVHRNQMDLTLFGAGVRWTEGGNVVVGYSGHGCLG